MIHLTSLIHTMSLYANRWGGQRYRVEELAKFLNKHLYNYQEEKLMSKERVNLALAGDAFLSSDHIPMYANSIKIIGGKQAWKIKDELGFEAIFAEGTEILTYVDHPEFGPLEWLPIESCSEGTYRVINLEKVESLKNDKAHHHLAFTDKFISIKCQPEEKQKMLCDGLNALMILKENEKGVEKISQFNSNCIQELYLVKITSVMKAGKKGFFDIDFCNFSYSLSKNKALSDKSENRYYKERKRTTKKRWLEKMRSKAFHMKKDKTEFKMELRKCE